MSDVVLEASSSMSHLDPPPNNFFGGMTAPEYVCVCFDLFKMIIWVIVSGLTCVCVTFKNCNAFCELFLHVCDEAAKKQRYMYTV